MLQRRPSAEVMVSDMMADSFDIMLDGRPQPEGRLDIPSCLRPYESIQFAMKDIPARYQQVYLDERADLVHAVAYFEEN